MSTMEAVRRQNKLKLLFEKIVEPNYVMNNYYADGLIEKLSRCSEPEISELASVPLLSDLLIDALSHSDNVHNTVKVFYTRILGLIAVKELHFSKIFAIQNDKILEGFKNINSQEMNSSLRVAYMEVALNMVKHNSGISWLLETGVWKEILSLCSQQRTVFVVRQTYKFASAFLWKLNDLDDTDNIKIVLRFILNPIREVDFLTLESLSSEQEDEFSKTLDPMIHILLLVVSTDNRIDKYTLLIDILINEYRIISHLLVVLDRIRKEDTCFILAKLIFWVVLAKVFLLKPANPDVTYETSDFLELTVTYFNTIQWFIQRRSPILVVDYCSACNLIWNSICKDKESIIYSCNDRQKILRNQMLFMCIVPVLVFLKYGKERANITDQKLNDFIVSLLNSSCQHTAKGAYALRDLIEELDTLPIIVQCVKKLTSLKSHLNNEQANLVFQAMFYILREYDPIDDFGVVKQEEHYEDCQEKVQVMTYVMDIVCELVKHHNINWHESLEVICLFTVVFNILQRPNLTTKFVVAALNVIALTVKKFLQPNLSLLLESKPGYALHELGKLIYMKLHDRNWEVRDSALELLLVCTEISYIKFPPFQRQIIENNLINVAAAIAFNDYEAYVQTSALKCIGAASKISAMWDQLQTQYPDIQDTLLKMLRNNEEGIVRKEACSVLCIIYQNLKLTPAFKQILCEHMVSSALSDFHWEVQMSAIKFWRMVYNSLLTDQGMLDGKFPPVTFSRESRKIVTLNEAEIQKRLIKIMDELASLGFLTVLVKLLHDDSEVEVMDSALTLATEIYDMLNKYKVPANLSPKVGEPESVEDLMCFIKEENDDFEMADANVDEPTADSVIESILDADDINLLANIYERHMSLQTNKQEAPAKPKIKLLKFASPYLFVNFLKSKDFKAHIDEMRKWNDGIRSVSSLLDDVLGTYEMNGEVNSLDCY